jgi:prephenate dehydrogenase
MPTPASDPAPAARAIAAARGAAAASLPDRIAFLGFGLIGGSIALALREAGCTARISAWTPAGAGPGEGLRRGLLDAAPQDPGAALDGAGLVILAGPPLSVLDHLGDLAGPMRDRLAPEATITDVASTKAIIVATAEDRGLAFVGDHPMAGRETAGVGSASAELFEGRPWVVAPAEGAGARDVECVEALATAVGGRPLRMAPIDHDLAVAAISHLPLIAAAALVEAVASDGERWPAARTLAAGGWRDMTRLARGDADMGAGILATNARPIAAWLRAYRDALDGWLAELERASGERGPVVPDAATVELLRARLASARAALERDGTDREAPA